MIKITVTQHAVGQGGFLVGTITRESDDSLSWIYDCGSNQTDVLNQAFANAKASGIKTITALFISHLDSDHVNGIDRLLSQFDVEEVVLPYLNNIDRIIHFSAEAAKGRLSGNFLNFCEAPVLWLSDRGVRRVIFVDPNDDDNEIPGESFNPPRDSPPDDGPDSPLARQWAPKPIDMMPSKNAVIEIGHSPIGHYSQLKAGQTDLNWILAPYCHRLSGKQVTLFKQALKGVLGTTALQAALDAARSSTGRKALRDCYDIIWADHNLVSMSLYAGPRAAHDAQLVVGAEYGEQFYWHDIRAPGWLSTGDANLARGRRRRAWLNYYEKVASFVGTLVLPHHGSAHNFDIEIVTKMPALQLALASAGPNGYGHPHREVTDAIAALKRVHYLKVSEKARTTVRMVYRPE